MLSSRLLSIAFALVACVLILPGRGDEPAVPADGRPSTIDLLCVDSSARWQPAICDTAGWRLAEGKLMGTADSEPLRYDCALGDFDLHVSWSVSEAGAAKLRLPAGDESQSIELRLAEEPGISIRMPHEARSLKIPDHAIGKAHAMDVHRLGDKFSLTVDGVRSRELAVDPSQRFGITLAVESGSATIESLRIVEPPTAPSGR